MTWQGGGVIAATLTTEAQTVCVVFDTRLLVFLVAAAVAVFVLGLWAGGWHR